MAVNNWMKNKEANPGFIPEEDEAMFPAMGMPDGLSGFVPDPGAPPSHAAYTMDKEGHKHLIVLHPEQERYGIDHEPGTVPKPRKKDPNEKKLIPF